MQKHCNKMLKKTFRTRAQQMQLEQPPPLLRQARDFDKRRTARGGHARGAPAAALGQQLHARPQADVAHAHGLPQVHISSIHRDARGEGARCGCDLFMIILGGGGGE